MATLQRRPRRLPVSEEKSGQTPLPKEEHPPSTLEPEQEQNHETFLAISNEVEDPAKDSIATEQLIHDLEAELKLTKDALARQEEQTREIRKEWNKQVSELMKLQTDRIPKLDDDYIGNTWSNLDYKIKDWAVQHFKKPKTHAFKKTPSMLIRTCLDFERYWQYDCLRAYIIRAAIWQEIKYHIFSDAVHQYGGAYGEAFETLKWAIKQGAGAGAKIKTRDYHTWRSMTSTLLASVFDRSNRHASAKKVKFDIIKDLAPYSTSLKMDLDRDLEDILIEAVDLDADLKQQRAHYYVQSPSWLPNSPERNYHFFFNAAHMESVEGLDPQYSNKTRVVLAMRPMLLKRGTSDGDKYSDITKISSAEVICEQHWSELIRHEDLARARADADRKAATGGVLGYGIQKSRSNSFSPMGGKR